ncbi:MAG: DUF494 domain-containing protein [Burkholderiales bacterium]|nr:DUF494 domain-containing protein [Burkholderiales bacterium]MDE2077147.1 DUF494 domain-containing protein [Burkholderiales bacterium]MDE2433354.1 DUF494 domain-containing protein [Burkholderiales bacterium]
MFDVLVYLYEHYWRPDACPEAGMLAKKLSAVGFETDEINDALSWLSGLHALSAEVVREQSLDSVRVYSASEIDHLGLKALGFLQFLSSAGVLTPGQREIVLDRVMAVPGDPVDLEDLKIIVLMLFWSLGKEPDVLILDELFVEDDERLIH